MPFFLISQNKIIYVAASATGTQDGSSWQNAYADLQDALKFSQKGDEIWVAKGVYYPTKNNDRVISYEIKNGVNIFGGFKGDENAKNKRDFNQNRTILSGNIGNKSDSTDNTYRILSATDIIDTTYLDGIEITEAVSDKISFIFGQKKGVHGAGLYIATSNFNKSNKLFVQNCRFYKNATKSNGSAIFYDCEYPSNISINLKKNEFYNNVSGYGGCIKISENSPMNVNIDSCNFTNNLSLSGGGAIFIEIYLGESFDTKISNCNFNKNKLLVGGEGISILGIVAINTPTKLDITKCSFSDEIYGIAVSIIGNFCTSLVQSCHFSNLDGCLKLDAYRNTKVNNSFFINTQTAIESASISLNNTIIKNSIRALHINAITTTIDSISSNNNLFVNNKYLCSDNSFINLKKKFINSIFINNGFENGSNEKSYSFANSLIDKDFFPSGITCTNCSYANPLFVDTSKLDFRLQACSPAINAGNNLLSSDLVTDINGKPRFRYGKIDIGPYEYDEYDVNKYDIKTTICKSAKGSFLPNVIGNCSASPTISWLNSENKTGIGGENLAEGTYTFFVKDDKNLCTDTIKNVKIDSKNLLGISSVNVRGVSKKGETDGFIRIISISNGTAPFQYKWSNSDTTALTKNLTEGTYQVSITDANGCFYTTAYTIGVVTATNDTDESIGLAVFPNPSNNIITIFWQDKIFDFKFLDTQGKIYFSEKNTREKAMLETTNFLSGFYILQVTDNQGFVKNKKILIQH